MLGQGEVGGGVTYMTQPILVTRTPQGKCETERRSWETNEPWCLWWQHVGKVPQNGLNGQCLCGRSPSNISKFVREVYSLMPGVLLSETGSSYNDCSLRIGWGEVLTRVRETGFETRTLSEKLWQPIRRQVGLSFQSARGIAVHAK